MGETGEKFLLQQKLEKSQSCGRNWRKVPSAAETGNKTVLRQKLEKIQSAVETGEKFLLRQKQKIGRAHV